MQIRVGTKSQVTDSCCTSTRVGYRLKVARPEATGAPIHGQVTDAMRIAKCLSLTLTEGKFIVKKSNNDIIHLKQIQVSRSIRIVL